VQLGPAEILVVLVIALLVFGPNKLPEVGRQVGRAMREFRQFQQTMTRDMHEVFSEEAPASGEPAPSLSPEDATIAATSSDATSSDATSSEVTSSEVTSSEVTSSDERAGAPVDPEAHE